MVVTQAGGSSSSRDHRMQTRERSLGMESLSLVSARMVPSDMVPSVVNKAVGRSAPAIIAETVASAAAAE